MKHYKLILALCLMIALTSETCEEKRRAKSESGLFKGECPLERITWMKVSENYDKNRLIALAATLEAAAKADASQIKEIAEGNASAKLSSSLRDSLQKISEKKVEVSQEFYEKYLNHRTVVCNLYQAAKDEQMRKDPDFVKRAMNAFIDVNEAFAKIKDEEKKTLK